MKERWQKLADDVCDVQVDSEKLREMRSRVDDSSVESAELEIKRGIASALGRAEAKVLRAFNDLNKLGRELDTFQDEVCDDPGRISVGIDAYNQQPKQAHQTIWKLGIHREAVGLGRNFEILRQLYPLPPPR